MLTYLSVDLMPMCHSYFLCLFIMCYDYAPYNGCILCVLYTQSNLCLNFALCASCVCMCTFNACVYFSYMCLLVYTFHTSVYFCILFIHLYICVNFLCICIFFIHLYICVNFLCICIFV